MNPWFCWWGAGPPGSGKSVFLQTLAGINRNAKGMRISADELTYNGSTFSEFVVERSAAYVSQYDMHYVSVQDAGV